MQLSFRCSGGFANLSLDFQVDTANLPTDAASELEALVEQAGVFNMRAPPATSPMRPGPPDALHYELEVRDHARRAEISCTDVDVPAALSPLLDQLRRLALEARA